MLQNLGEYLKYRSDFGRNLLQHCLAGLKYKESTIYEGIFQEPEEGFEVAGTPNSNFFGRESFGLVGIQCLVFHFV